MCVSHWDCTSCCESSVFLAMCGSEFEAICSVRYAASMTRTLTCVHLIRVSSRRTSNSTSADVSNLSTTKTQAQTVCDVVVFCSLEFIASVKIYRGSVKLKIKKR